jgi:hypothetical protein
MADSKISDLPLRDALTGAEQFPLDQGLVTVKASLDDVKQYCNTILTLTDGTWSGIFSEYGILGEAVAFGELIYLSAADSKWYKADATTAATSGDVKVGVCVVGGVLDAVTTILYIGSIRADALFPTFTISGPVMISETPGEMTQTAPVTSNSVTRRIGFASTANEVLINISNDYYTHI